MSRTYRNRIAGNKLCRNPRHKGALVAASDEYGIRPGARPPTDYDDLPLSAWDEDFKHCGKFAAKQEAVYENKKRERIKNIDQSVTA